LAVGVFTVAFAPVPLLITGAADATDLAGTIWLAPMSILAGLLFNAVRNQGAWLHGRVLILETVLGRALISLDDIEEIHLNESLSLIFVKVGERYIWQSITAPFMFAGPRDARARVQALLGQERMSVHWYDDHDRSIWDLKPRHAASFERGAILSTLVRPWVVCMTVAGLGIALLLA
jgi:hypothetical protein